MKQTKDVTVIAMYTALLIAAQYALSFAAGVEVVSAMIAVFAAVFGTKKGVILAVSFSVVRCLAFGFFPTVIVLYLVYFPLYAFVMSLPAKKNVDRIWVAVPLAAALTACFTLIDDVLTPLLMSFSKKAWSAYFYSSLPTMLTHVLSVTAGTLVLYAPLKILLTKIRIGLYNS